MTHGDAVIPQKNLTTLSTQEWKEARLDIHRVVRHRLSGLDDAIVEDATQDALIRFHRACRHNQIKTPKAMWTTIAHRAAIDQLRAHTREKKRLQPIELHGPNAQSVEDVGRSMDVDPYGEAVFMIQEYFLKHQKSDCLYLAKAVMEGVDWKQVAAKLNRSHAAVRQQWSRCVRSLKKSLSGSLGGSSLDDWAKGA
jgi:DNA-directed RNA polymerase specialized sigma24 family protein